MKANLFSSFLISFSISQTTVEAYEVPHLIKPQLGFELNLIFPDSSFHRTTSLPQVLTQSMEHLVAHQVPFRLMYNTSGIWPTPQPAHSLRHMENQVAHLVFLTIRSKRQALDLQDVFTNCVAGSWLTTSSTIPKHCIEVIITDDSALTGPPRNRFVNLDVQPYLLPLYFIIFYWSSNSHKVVQVREGK